MKKLYRTPLLGLAAALTLGLAACTSSQGGAQQEAEPAGGDAAGVADTPEKTVAMITHAVPGDTFWDLVRDGAKVAAAKDNIDLQYSSDPQGPQQATLVQNAIDQKVDGIAVTLAKPEAMAGAVQAARDAGIPVVALNSGLNDWKDVGAMMYFGQDEEIAGVAAGERLSEAGAKHVICVIQEQGHVGLESRCAGVKKGFTGETEILYVNGEDMPSVESTIANKLRTTPSIDRVLTLGGPFAMTALQAVEAAGSDAKVVTFDLNEEVVQAIQNGDILWAIDQQPFVQGYLAVDSLWLYLNHGSTIGGSETVLTGPSFVDESNVDTVAGQN
jgi:simple sugar transport system substrate-binding protein